MGTTFKYAPQRWSSEISDPPPVDEEGPGRAVAAEDIFDDPSILNELNEATASLAVRRDARPVPRIPARLPSVDAFDFVAACSANDFEGPHGANDSEEAHRAKSLAHRLGPPSYDHGPKRRWWSFAPAPNRRGERDADWRGPPPYGQVRSGGRRAVFWSVCGTLAFIVAAPVVFGSFRPSSQPPSGAVTDVRNGGEASISPAAEVTYDTPAAGNEGAKATAAIQGGAGRLPNETVVIRNQPAAAAIIAPATTALASPLVRPAPVPDGSNAETPPAETPLADISAADTSPADTSPADTSPAGAPPPARTLDATASEPAPTNGAPESAAPVTGKARTAGAADEDFTRMAQSQLSVNANPSQEQAAETTTGEVTSATEAGASQLSAEQVDRLLERGEELLRTGNIASARLLFLRVAAAGDRRGAKAVGMTYDPKVYARLPVMGLTPDLDLAELWYGKAGGDLSYTIDLTSAQAAEPADDDAQQQWNAACARKYQSFDPSTGLYVARSGTKRRCQLP